MYNSKKVLGLIVAREGSKGLPGKNVKSLCGKPVIAYSIEAAKGSRYIDSFIVSTDGEEIREVSERFGAEVPFLRPKELSGDLSKIDDVLKHATEFLKKRGDEFDVLVLLQATSPLRTSRDIDEALEEFFSKSDFESRTLISVCEAPSKMAYLMRYNSLNEIELCFKENVGTQRQENKSLFVPNGAIYILNLTNLNSGFYAEHIVPYVMEVMRSVDIDTIEDFLLAEDYISSQKK